MLDFIKAVFNVLRKAVTDWFEDNASRQAAALAYYGVLSLAPLLVIAITIAGIFFGRADIQQEVITQTRQAMGNGSAELVNNVLNATYNNDGGVLATFLSLGILLFAGSNIFAQLKMSLNQIWNVNEGEDQPLLQGIVGFIRDRLISSMMVIGFGFLLIVSQILGTIVSVVIYSVGDISIATISLLQVVNVVVSIAFSTLIIGLIFRFLPDKELGWSDVWIGAFFTSILFAVAQRFINLYIENAGVASAYGVAGSVIVILLWIYFSTSILLFGGEFTNAYSELYGLQADNKSSTESANTSSNEAKTAPQPQS